MAVTIEHDGKTIPTAPVKDPDSTVDYGFDWTAWLPTGDTISASVWIVPAGLTEVSNVFDDTTTAIMLSGGTVDSVYTVTNRVTTTPGARTDDRSFYLRVKEK